MRRLLVGVLVFAFAACGGGAGSASDGGAADAAAADAAALPDAGANAGDGAASVTAILGTLAGPCPALSGMLHSPSPSLVNDRLVFVSGEQYTRAELSPGGQTMYDIPNAGGSSIESEIMSYEILHYCEGAELYKTETEIGYAPPDDAGASTITDYEVTIGGDKVGVSVTRAYKPGGMTDTEVHDLLVKKLEGIVRSSQRVLPGDRWVKQILSIYAPTPTTATQIATAWAGLDPTLKADTIVLATNTAGGGFIYCRPEPALGTECP
jgi:hypothetical protein